MFSTGLTEIVLIVKDVKAAARFYREVVGLIPQREANDAWAWFFAGKPESLQRLALHKGSLLFEEHSPFPEGERWGRVHYAFNVPRERLEEAVAHVQKQGVEVYGPVHFDWRDVLSYYFYDLDGHLLEFWSPQTSS
ncbi:MAG TPA: VOC family protein [Ktedonobacteraceae bacterium]|jgi:catechol 2,3-dioxygenase-like lactoylglutathione lyase family enzyme